MSEFCFEPRSWATTGKLLWIILENLTESVSNWTSSFCLLSSSRL